MKKITNYSIKKWNLMWKLWKIGLLDSPLNELATYCNYMANGHYNYLRRFKNDHVFKYNLFILKQYIPAKHIDHLLQAKEIYDSYKTKEEKKYLKEHEENIFASYDELYFDEVGFVENIILDKLRNGEYTGIPKIFIFNLNVLKYKIKRK